MNKKNDVEVLIQNKRYTLSGYESGEYLQKIASYINEKYSQLKEKEFYKQLDNEMKNILIQINLADDYFKATDKVKELKAMNDTKSEEIYEMKHEIIAVQTELDTAKKEMELLKKELMESQKKVIKLESSRRR